MMKTIILNFFLLVTSLSIAQGISVVYEDGVVYPNDSENNYKYDWKLDVNKGESLYYPLDEIKDGKKAVTVTYKGETFESIADVVRNYNIFYLNQVEDKQVLQHHFNGNDYIVEEPLMKYKWDILNETKKIDIYNCRAATTINEYGYEVKVWYTEEIPVSIGPFGYSGLPGLILELKFGFKHILAKNINFDSSPIIDKPCEGAIKTRDEYNSFVGISAPKNSSKTTVEKEGNTTVTTTIVHKVVENKPEKKGN